MALKALLLKKKLDAKRAALRALLTRRDALQAREEELEASIDEVTEETTQEERDALDAEVAAFETDRAVLDQEQADLEEEIRGLESELDTEEAAQDTTPPASAAPAAEPNERKEMKTMNTRSKIFGRMSMAERSAFVERDDVKAYLTEIRSCIKEKRALTNVGLTIPTVMLGLLRENIEEFSKLYKHVNVRPVAGEGRMIVMGTFPEAVWTDCCANLNELDLGFNDAEVNCWKVGGCFAVCNANLEDSDIDLAAEVLTALGQAIGRALDKAILYGTGSRMPLGIVPRLAQQSEPAGYPATARPWVDLHSSNIKTTNATGADLFKTIVTDFGAAKGKYSRGEIVHVMNETTYTYLMGQAMSINAAGAIVSGVGATMPVIGGVIEVLDFVPDYQIISGYFDLYLLAERAGQQFASSEHVKFLSDQTVFRGTARYDGLPVIAEGFVLVAVNNQSAVTSKSFPDDGANSVQSIRLNTNTATIVGTGTVQLVAFTEPGIGTVSWASATTSKATVNSSGLVTGVSSGSSVITASCNGLTASCTVTVTT